MCYNGSLRLFRPDLAGKKIRFDKGKSEGVFFEVFDGNKAGDN